MNPAYDAGRAARLSNNVAQSNPYKDNTPETTQWKQGWDSVIDSSVGNPNTVIPASPMYAAGKDARTNGVVLTQNPYVAGTLDYNEWSNGWNDANHTPASGLPLKAPTPTPPHVNPNIKK